MTTVSVDMAQKELPDLIQDVVLGGHVVITRGNLPVAQLIPIAHQQRQPVFGSAAGLVSMAEDFNDPLDDFAEYVK